MNLQFVCFICKHGSNALFSFLYLEKNLNPWFDVFCPLLFMIFMYNPGAVFLPSVLYKMSFLRFTHINQCFATFTWGTWHKIQILGPSVLVEICWDPSMGIFYRFPRWFWFTPRLRALSPSTIYNVFFHRGTVAIKITKWNFTSVTSWSCFPSNCSFSGN